MFFKMLSFFQQKEKIKGKHKKARSRPLSGNHSNNSKQVLACINFFLTAFKKKTASYAQLLPWKRLSSVSSVNSEFKTTRRRSSRLGGYHGYERVCSVLILDNSVCRAANRDLKRGNEPQVCVKHQRRNDCHFLIWNSVCDERF